MYVTALIIDCAIACLYRHNGAMNKSVKLEPGTTEWNETYYRDYTWSMLNRNIVFKKKLLQRRASYSTLQIQGIKRFACQTRLLQTQNASKRCAKRVCWKRVL